MKLLLLPALLMSTIAPLAHAESHSYVNLMRSSSESHIFVQQSVDGEFGRYEAVLGAREDHAGNQRSGVQRQLWKGYGIGTTVGIELMKFIQFTTGHSFINMRHKDDALESLLGSRVHAGLRTVFLSPVGNLEAGAGLQGSRLDYQKQLEHASFVGNGVYYSLGINYFLSSRVSLYYEAKMTGDHLVRNSGSAVVEAIDTDTTVMGIGFRLWM